jgi:DNA-binding PadR family transcriptional regulator
MIITNKEIALLGLLNEKPMHGYEIEHEVYQRDMRYWTEISISSIYKVLKKMEAKGLVKSQVKLTEKNVAQKINKITAAGKKALKDNVEQLITGFDHHRWELDLAITNLDVLSTDEIIECIEKYILKIKELENGYKELEKYMKKEGCPNFRLALAVRPQYLYKAELEWANDYLKSFKAE